VHKERLVHSLHAYFLHAGDPAVPLIYSVDLTRDTRTMSTRRVTATQHNRPVFILTASFMTREDGPEHQDPMPDAPDPETLPTFEERFAPLAEKFPRRAHTRRPIDIRHVDVPPIINALSDAPVARSADSQVWLRAAGRLPDDPLLHVCVLAYASDMTLLDAVLAPHGINWTGKGVFIASLDHAMWFHGDFRSDEWLLYDQHSPWAGRARGLAMGRIFTHDGRLICDVVQEGLVRRLQ
jgi:acyl-CoA thioesterase-2